MKRKIVKISLVVILVVLISFVMGKMYHFVVIKNVHEAIENFKKEENKYYSVTMIKSDKSEIKEEIFVKDNILKCNEIKNKTNIHCDWIDFNSLEQYVIDFKNKNFRKEVVLKNKDNLLINLPSLINNIYKSDKLNLKEFFKIKHILPIQYNDEKCYKIITNTEIIIVSRDTHLLKNYSLKFTNSNQDSESKSENFYEFEIDEVTEEEIALPDLTEYTNSDEK